MEQHERYEEFAVGHVLGGLDAADAADFRSHLLGCRECRLRVAELRDIAADLAAAEREERAEARVRTEVARQVDEAEAEAGADAPPRLRFHRQVGIVLVLVVGVVGLLAFWNLHLRTQNVTSAAAADRSSATLRELAEGVPVATDLAPPTTGLVVVDGDEIAFTFTALPPLGPEQRYVLWLLGTDEGDLPVLVGVPDEQRSLAGLVADEGAAELVLTVEVPPWGASPTGREVVRADLSRAAGS